MKIILLKNEDSSLENEDYPLEKWWFFSGKWRLSSWKMMIFGRAGLANGELRNQHVYTVEAVTESTLTYLKLEVSAYCSDLSIASMYI